MPIGKFNDREPLVEKFNKYKSEWQFEEIEDGQPLPEYFFDDGCDLSYILHNLQRDEPDQYSEFTAEEL